MPDLAFSGAGNIVNNWTVQMLGNTAAGTDLGYETKAPDEEHKEEKEDDGE